MLHTCPDLCSRCLFVNHPWVPALAIPQAVINRHCEIIISTTKPGVDVIRHRMQVRKVAEKVPQE
eukprot:COSAG06_NODE_887_length_11768_cov_28.624732_5_plen_65_part_00